MDLRSARLATTTTFVLNGFTVGAFVARIPDFKATLAISDKTLGASLLFVSIGVFLALRPAGRLAARFGSRPMIFAATLALALAQPLVGLLFSLKWTWFTFFLFGFTIATQDISMNAHAVAIEQRAGRRLMSVFHGMFSVGTLAGGLLGGLFSQLSITPLRQCLALMVLLGVMAFVIRPRLLSAEVDRHPIERHGKQRHPFIFWILGLFGLFAAISEGAAGDWGGVLARDAFSASPFVSTLPYIFFCVAMIIGRLSGDFLAHRFGASRVITAGGIIAGTGLAIGLIVGGIPILMAAWFLLGLGLSVVIPLMFSAAGTIATKQYAGVIAPSEAVATVSGVSYFGFVFGPPLIGFLAQHFTLRSALFLIVICGYFLIFASRYAQEA